LPAKCHQINRLSYQLPVTRRLEIDLIIKSNYMISNFQPNREKKKKININSAHNNRGRVSPMLVQGTNLLRQESYS
jgi:hypothetical protein